MYIQFESSLLKLFSSSNSSTRALWGTSGSRFNPSPYPYQKVDVVGIVTNVIDNVQLLHFFWQEYGLGSPVDEIGPNVMLSYEYT